MINGHPPLIVYEEEKSLYYDALRVYDEREEIDPLYRFLVYCVERTWDATARIADSEKPDRKGMNDLLES